MAHNAVGSTMPELQLRHELKNRFPEVTNSTLMKVMKLHNNDTQKCIQALEQESQRSVSVSTDIHPPSHSNDLNHNSYNRPNSSGLQSKPVGLGPFSSVSQATVGMQRYQEVPVKHETTHISTVKHNVAPPVPPPTVPPKPLPPKPDQSSFAVPGLPSVQSRPTLVINPANRGDPRLHTAPVPPPDFSSFLESSRKQTDIPNIRCGPLTSESSGANSGSPEARRPVRVINVPAGTGGTVMSGAVLSPTSACSNPRFRVLLGDGGGLCSMPTTSTPITSSSVNPYTFSRRTFIQSPQPRVQEPERGAVHSSSIYIDPPASSRIANVNESVSDSSVSAHLQPYRSNAQYMEAQGPSSNSVPRTLQPLTVSLSSHAVGQGTPEQGQNAVSFAGNPYIGGYNPGFGHTASAADSSFAMNRENRFSQEGASASPPLAYHVSLASQAMNQMGLTSGSGVMGPSPGPSAASSPSVMGPGMVGVMYGMSPILMPKAPRLQHQPSTGSSTSRSNSMDSEHSGTHHPSDLVLEPPFQPHAAPPLPPHRVMGVVMPGTSPMSTSSQSSISSDPSMHDRDQQRRRSGSIQEEAAYTQALLVHQRQRMDKLTEDIEEKRQLLLQLRHEVSEAEKSKIVENSLRTSFPTADDISRLCESNRRLQTDIQMYLNEIDMYKNGQTPFSIIDPMGQQNFFNNMPTGPNDLFSRPPIHRPRTPPPSPPPRPPPPRHPPHPVQRVNSNDLSTTVPAPAPGQMQGGGSADSEEGEKWACTACTFENHPALKKCEICEMPRLMPGS